MKTLLSFCAILIAIGMSDLNPLLLWQPYRIWINEVLRSSPYLLLGIFFSALFIGAWINASYECEKKKTAL